MRGCPARYWVAARCTSAAATRRDLGRPLQQLAVVARDHLELAELRGLSFAGGQGPPERGLDPVLGLGQVRRRRGLARDRLHLGGDDRLGLLGLVPPPHLDPEGIEPGVAGGRRAAVHRGGDLFLDHEPAVQPGRRSAREDLVEHLEGRPVGRGQRGGRRADHQPIGRDRPLDLCPAVGGGGRLGGDGRRGPGIRWRDGSVVALDVLEHGLGLEASCHHDDGVVGRVEGPIKMGGLVLGDGLDVPHATDHRVAVGVPLEGLAVEGLVQGAVDAVVDGAEPLLGDHVPLGPDLLLGQGEVDHAVGLQLDGQRQGARGELVDVGGKVVVGHRVRVGAGLLHAPVELPGGARLLCLGEHEVLEQVGQPGLAGVGVLVARADPEPGHVGDARRRLIGDQHHLEPVPVAPLADGQGAQGRLADQGAAGRLDRGGLLAGVAVAPAPQQRPHAWRRRPPPAIGPPRTMSCPCSFLANLPSQSCAVTVRLKLWVCRL